MKPASSSPARMAATWPSIIALGATTSAPARAWATAVSASRAIASSLMTVPGHVHRAAMAMVGVLAQARVGDEDEVQPRVADATEGLLDDAVLDPGTGPDRRPSRPAGRTG